MSWPDEKRPEHFKSRGPSAATTLTAFEPEGRTMIHFTDLVAEGDVVDVFDTFEQAENDEGPHRKMRVYRDEDDWWVEAL